MPSRTRLDAWKRAWRSSARRWQELAPVLQSATGWRAWNPGEYGEPWHASFRRCYPPGEHPLVILGLNPGPYGMAQTGIPFTDIRRLISALPRLAQRLRETGARVEVPGLAPESLRPFLRRTFESSSVRIYRFLERGWGSAETGWRDVVVANPCTLLFVDPGMRKNRTPADLAQAIRARKGSAVAQRLAGECDRLRVRCAVEALQALHPRGAVLLGRSVQSALGPVLSQALGRRSVISWEHPARAVPERWASGLLESLGRQGLAPKGFRSDRGCRK